jgi:colanic acid/amylovoran biosynthesis glycosyltransferase
VSRSEPWASPGSVVAPVTYLLTNYPSISHTFIAEEIDALRDQGVHVRPVAINVVREIDRVGAEVQERERDTVYLKSTPKLRAVYITFALVLRHPRLLVIPLKLGRSDVRTMGRWYLQLVEAIILERYMRSIGSRHVHAHFGFATATIAMFAARVSQVVSPRRSLTWSMTIHGWHEFTAEQDARLALKLGSAEFTAAVSDFTRSQLFRIAKPEHWSRVHVVRCGIDLTRFSRRPAVPTGRPRVIVIARLSPEKGHLVLLEAVAALRSRGLTCDLEVVGPDYNDYLQVLRARSVELEIEDCVHFAGGLPSFEVAARLVGASVFCLPTFAEGLPIVLMEAMARGVPVVSTYIAGIPELAVDGRTARVVPAGRADLLADALADLLTDQAMVVRLTEKARQTVVERHNVHSNVRKLAELFAGIVQSSRVSDQSSE